MHIIGTMWSEFKWLSTVNYLYYNKSQIIYPSSWSLIIKWDYALKVLRSFGKDFQKISHKPNQGTLMKEGTKILMARRHRCSILLREVSLLLRGFLLCCNMSLEHPLEGPQGTFPLYKFMRNYQDPFVWNVQWVT